MEPQEIWVMAYHTHNAVGSISHVSSGEPYYFSQAACQQAIDSMEGWLGMGDRSQYRPIKLVPAPGLEMPKPLRQKTPAERVREARAPMAVWSQFSQQAGHYVIMGHSSGSPMVLGRGNTLRRAWQSAADYVESGIEPKWPE